MLMLGGQGGEVELCPKATHYCIILYSFIYFTPLHQLGAKFFFAFTVVHHSWEHCHGLVMVPGVKA